MLEGYAAERAASRVDAHGLEELDALVARMSGLRTGADLLSATRVNAAFHLRIAEAADKARGSDALIRGLVHTPLALIAQQRLGGATRRRASALTNTTLDRGALQQSRRGPRAER